MAGIRDKEFGTRDPGVNMQLRNLLKIIFINLVYSEGPVGPKFTHILPLKGLRTRDSVILM